MHPYLNGEQLGLSTFKMTPLAIGLIYSNDQIMLFNTAPLNIQLSSSA